MIAAGLVVFLPLFPELLVQLHSTIDFRALLRTLYYPGILSVFLLSPALVLPDRWAGRWIAALAAVFALPTAVCAFYALAHGTRWNLTAHTAAFQSNASESLGYLQSFVTVGRLAGVLVILAAFLGAAWLAVRSELPRRRTRFVALAAMTILCSYGALNVLRFGRDVIRPVKTETSNPVLLFGVGGITSHPLVIIPATHFNYHSTRDYYLTRFKALDARLHELSGARLLGPTSPRLLVVVIGESANRLHWSLYGYKRPTTPRLDSMRSELFVFSDVVSTTVGTLSSIRSMFTADRETLPVFPLFSNAGYTTHWISSQMGEGFDDLELGALVASCDHRVFLGGAFDENLLPHLQHAIQRPGPQLVFLNLMGSHIRYSDRYPARFARFDGHDEVSKVRATYDNSIYYTDHVLGEIIEMLRLAGESACLLYASDHGEDVYDSTTQRLLFRDESTASNAMFEVPYFVWLSSAYRKQHPEIVDRLTRSVDRPYQNREMFHPLLSLTRLDHSLYDATRDPLSDRFVVRPRPIGAAGRIYERAPAVVATVGEQ